MQIEERENKTTIVTMNINGFPSNKANKYKTKAVNNLLGENDILVELETGINDEDELILVLLTQALAFTFPCE